MAISLTLASILGGDLGVEVGCRKAVQWGRRGRGCGPVAARGKEVAHYPMAPAGGLLPACGGGSCIPAGSGCLQGGIRAGESAGEMTGPCAGAR